MLYVTNLGDSQVLVLRPRNSKVIFKTAAQWHWFDCPRQLGTNSPDTPRGAAVVDKVVVEVGDVVLAVSDGVTDNLWEHEVVSCVVGGMREWEEGEKGAEEGRKGEMQFVAEKLMNAARVIAQDPFAESPFMEHAIEEGLAMEGGEFLVLLVVRGNGREANGLQGSLMILVWWLGLLRRMMGDGPGGLGGFRRACTTSNFTHGDRSNITTGQQLRQRDLRRCGAGATYYICEGLELWKRINEVIIMGVYTMGSRKGNSNAAR